MYNPTPKRHPDNSKLRLYYDGKYLGWPVYQYANGPLIENYLEASLRVLQHTCSQQCRTLAFRLDLRFPQTMPVGPMHADNACLSQFFYTLRMELGAADTKYTTEVRYLWCRE
ncbi:inovirus Gp2 family protein [Aidingimonas lacisalsi]|nr:inovirus Gp2 family protein [Aidingimonas lacisalsi]